MKIVLIGLWLTLVSLGAAYGAALMSAAPHEAAHAEVAPLQHEKTRAINVPIILDGALQGFVSLQFVYTIDGTALKSLAVPPEVYLLDAAFSDVYMDPTIDFRHLEKMDVPKFTKRLVDETNAHLGAPLIKDVLVDAMSYVPKEPQKD